MRILYSCSYENSRALNTAIIERALYRDGAFYVAGVFPEKVAESADRNDMSGTETPEENLREYLSYRRFPEEKIQELVEKARPIIAEAEAGMPMGAGTGKLEPVEIEVENYRNYEKEKFSFEDVSFCTINGENGAGKSSLFMDAIIDCLYEKPREGKVTRSDAQWLRKDEGVASGSITFTFRVGEKTFRVLRKRKKAGDITLNLSELVDGEWEDRSKGGAVGTQAEIINTIGMDDVMFRSCALIMQDQYGLFLEAKPGDRMAVLSSLLGLGVYDAMCRIAGDKEGRSKSEKRKLDEEITIHEAALEGLGKPEDEIGRKKEELKLLSETARGITAERDARKLELLSLQEAQERCNRLTEVISSLTAKKAATETNRGNQAEVIEGCKALLESEQVILEKTGRYRELEARKRELIEAAALYKAKQADVARTGAQVSAIGSDLETAKMALAKEQDRLAAYEDTSNDEEILQKAEEYKGRKEELDGLQWTALEHQQAEQKVQGARTEQESVEKSIKALDDMIGSARSFLGKDIAILSDNCGCIDILNANCKFLKKAKNSRLELQKEEEKYGAKRAVLEAELAERKEAVAKAVAQRDAVGYEPEKKAEAERRCAELLPYVALAEQAREKASKIAILKASIGSMQLNIHGLIKRLEEAAEEAEAAKAEMERHRSAYFENEGVTREMEGLAPWVEREKQLPVMRERLSNAEQRFSELDALASEQEKELAEKQEELSREFLKTAGLAEKQEEVSRLNGQLDSVNADMEAIQRRIGTLDEQMKRAAELRKKNRELSKLKIEAAKEAADYEILKGAFSQRGIPHQVMRSVIPKLTSTANSILGQMTGGRMGVDFQTESVLKSDNSKERPTLDIIIEEYGKSALPYLSKSGGEKVKASLSVILALAEVKSSSAGIQLGMLFIDEAPFLDGDGVQAYVDALETIQRRYAGIKVMAITHDPTFKARFPQSITVEKDEQGSHVRWDGEEERRV